MASVQTHRTILIYGSNGPSAAVLLASELGGAIVAGGAAAWHPTRHAHVKSANRLSVIAA